MRPDHDILGRAAGLVAQAEPFVLITVIETRGSTPRDPGARMIVRREGPPIGTVGGGQFEQLVIDSAMKHLADYTAGREHFVLGSDADQCCGGTMDVFFEYIGPRQRVVIFGAGHVAREVHDVLESAPLELVIVDDRADWNTAERFPRARRIRSWVEGLAVVRERPGDTLACVMTCSHDTDFDLLRALLDGPPAFLGLIGSRSKRACLFGRLAAAGADIQAIERVHCPIGLGDMGKEPRMVAISIAGQLLLESKRLDEAARKR